MKVSRSVIMILLVLLLACLIALMAQPAHAQGPVEPTPPPKVVTTPNPVDQNRAEADRWETVANNAVASAQAAIGQAYSAIASAEAGLRQAQIAAQQEHAARVSAEAGQIQQAVTSAQAALIASNQAAGLSSESSRSAIESLKQSTSALSDVRTLREGLRESNATIEGLTGASRIQQARITQLETYSWSIYRETITAWVIVGVLALVLIAGLLALIIVIATERRNRWPRFRNGIGSALIVPMENQSGVK